MKFGVLCILVLGVTGNTPTSPPSCHNVQLSSQQPCAYQTSDCLDGAIQWNYPTHECEWTFSPRGAKSMVLSATWATATGVNLTFFDGPGPNHKQLGFVAGGDKDQQSANITSTTGVIYVKLTGPPDMITYALIFDYTISPTGDRCAAYHDDCAGCLSAGCSLIQASRQCMETCPADQQCLTHDSSSEDAPAVVCANRGAHHDAGARCASKGSCTACRQAGCQWGGAVGAVPSCIASCDPTQGCNSMAVCPDSCSMHQDCVSCLSAGCSMMGLNRFNCVLQCPMDIPCFTPSTTQTASQTCAIRQTLVDRTAFCKLQHDCNTCLSVGCQWNARAGPLNACVTGCGFSPCELVTQCPAAQPATGYSPFTNSAGPKGKRRKHNMGFFPMSTFTF